MALPTSVPHWSDVVDSVLRSRSGNRSRVSIRALIAISLACSVFYGCAMGSFGGLASDRFLQMAYSGVKTPMLMALAFGLCVLPFYILHALAGVASDFRLALRFVWESQAVLTLVMACLAPYTLVVYASITSYRWAVLFNGLVFLIATLIAQMRLRKLYREIIRKNAVHRTLIVAWLFLYIFVAIQLAWVLRPFIGSPFMAVRFFREDAFTNAYIKVWNLVFSG